MLQDKFLPKFHFNEIHHTTISASAEKVFAVVKSMDFSGSWIVRILFRLRGLPARTAQGLEGLKAMGFCLLEVRENQEIIVGLVGQFWRPAGNIQFIQPDEFVRSWPTHAKASWNFVIKPEGDSQCVLETETRIACENRLNGKRFALYWFFIRPFSGIVRKEILRSIKRKAESNS